MRDPSSLGDAIDLALDLPDWHRRHVVARAFLRAMPCIFSEPEPDTEQDNPVTQQHLLNLYRAGLLLAVAAELGPVAADTESLERLRLPGEGARLDICISAKNAARSAVVTTDFSTERCSELCLADAFGSIAKYESENDLDLNITFRKVAADAMRGDISASSNPETLSVSNPLYSSLAVFPTMDRTFTGAGYPKVSSGRAAGPDFLSTKFWHDWYWGILAGKPLDWELQRRVALIDDAIWEAGAEAVAQEIEWIERLFELEREIAALKATLPRRSALSTTNLIGDNGGPPLDDGVRQAVRGDFVLIWDQIEDLEAEIAKPDPSPGRLKAIAKTLWDISVRIAAYCGGKIDLALTEASKEAGKAVAKWGAPIAAASLASQNESIQQVSKAIWAFVKTLPPGL